MVLYNKNTNRILMLCLSISMLLSCHTIKPFLIKNKKKESRKEKRAEKKIERKENKIEKQQEKIDDLKNLIVKTDSLPSSKKDSLIIKPLDTALAKQWIQNHKIEYEAYQCKAKIHFESDKEKHNFNINFRLKKDSIIWASITAPIIGEVARAVITPDSVKAFERINKKYFLYSYLNIQKLINLEVDFKTLQEMILGNVIASEGKITEIKELGLLFNIFIKGEDFTNQLSYLKNDSTLTLMQLQTSRPASSSSLLIALSDYQIFEQQKLPTQRKYNILDIKGAIELTMDINKVEFNHTVDYPFNIPKNYHSKD